MQQRMLRHSSDTIKGNDRFIKEIVMARLFGTDGVRGVANIELTPDLAFNLGKAGALVLGKISRRPVFVIGKDTRISGDMLEAALTAGILSVGGDVIRSGVIPTPGVAYLVRHFQADAGVVISASHNPFEFNGIKFFNGKGFKLDDAIEDEIEALIKAGFPDEEPGQGRDLGHIKEAEKESLDAYVDFLLSTVDIDLKGVKIVLDCANGASYKSSPAVYRALGADVTVIGDKPDGININDHIGSTHPEQLQKKVVEEGADIGFAFDGDADRLISVDEKGQIVDGDKAMCICADHLKANGELAENLVTCTVMSNLGFHKYLKSRDIDIEVTTVGDRYVLESMLKTGGIIGGEQSGHIIFLNHSTTGDGCLSSLQLIKAVQDSGKKISELADPIRIYPQVLVNAKVKNSNKEAYKDDPEIMAAIGDCEKKMEGNGRVLIRPSGTEPLVRVMIEGDDIKEIREMAQDIADLIERKC